MKLTKVRVTEFQSIQDSTEFDIGDVSCLVGKNESGKTALLKALYRLNPIVDSDGTYNVTIDYPRRTMVNYETDVENGRREDAVVVKATFALDEDDIAAVSEIYGPDCLVGCIPTIHLRKGYSNTLTQSGLTVDTDAAVHHLVGAADLPSQVEQQIHEQRCLEAKINILKNAGLQEASQDLLDALEHISEHGLSEEVFRNILKQRVPKLLYFDEYYQLKGQDNLDRLLARVAQEALEPADYPLLGLIDLAGLNVEQLSNPRSTTELIAQLQAAQNRLTNRVREYWTQNLLIGMKFDIRPALPEDPVGMTDGTNIWGLIEDTRHGVTTELGSRSRGFIWFFSFLAWYQYHRSAEDNSILLLDEPGLSLHAKAQGDLLVFFERELKPNHQIIYTTHSPFMVDPARFDRVRIVQDLSIELDSSNLPMESQGTKVVTDVLNATEDSLFPLQNALGYEISQTLFVGRNNLVVEGPSDLMYIQTISTILQRRGEPGLSTDWTITPVGGSDKVPTFVALMGSQPDLNLAVLVDYQKRDQQKIEDLYKSRLTRKKQVLTYADFVEGAEADVEDMLGDEFYLELVNGEYGMSLTVDQLHAQNPRVIRRVEQCLSEHPIPDGVGFNHYRPARYLQENIGLLEKKLTDQQLDRFRELFKTLNGLL